MLFMYDENIKLLANAVILRACIDYERSPGERYGLEMFFRSDWFNLLSRGSCDPERLISFLKGAIKNGTKIYGAEKFFGNRGFDN